MTREEAIREFESELEWAKLNIYPYISKQKIEANTMAIKALEQEPILDKIRAEIEEVYLNITYKENHKVGGSWGLRKALEIIDKYKAESEDKRCPQ